MRGRKSLVHTSNHLRERSGKCTFRRCYVPQCRTFCVCFFFNNNCRFLMDLEHRMEESILISDVCDIVYNHAVEHFKVFVNYVINQVYQESNYRRIL